MNWKDQDLTWSSSAVLSGLWDQTFKHLLLSKKNPLISSKSMHFTSQFIDQWDIQATHTEPHWQPYNSINTSACKSGPVLALGHNQSIKFPQIPKTGLRPVKSIFFAVLTRF